MKFADDTKLRCYQHQESRKAPQEKLFAQDTEILWNIMFCSAHLCSRKTKLNWNKNTEGFGKWSIHFMRKNENIMVYLAQANEGLEGLTVPYIQGKLLKSEKNCLGEIIMLA